MENKMWYAVMLDREDTDWGYGSDDFEKAKQMVVDSLDNYPDAYIAVIDTDGDGLCVGEIYPEDF